MENVKLLLEKTKKKRNLLLRDYQIPASNFIMENDLAVLAMCPGGGKTEIAIDVITRYLTFNPNNRVLVLAHSRNEIKKNFINRLNELILPFTYSEDLNDNSQVHVCLPQNQRKIIGTYGLLIVDEAHENYLSSKDREYQIPKIIKYITPEKQLLLTGSPAKFINLNQFKNKIFFMSMNEIPEQYFAKLNIELIAHKAYWKNQRNQDLEIKSTYKYKKEEVKVSIEKIIESLIIRLKTKVSAEVFNKQTILYTVSKLLFSSLGKTIIYCHSTSHANMVYNILKSKEINCVLSHSRHKEEIKEDSNLTDFYNNKFDVLVVVRRATLGYSDDNLFNIIDMSGTHNINVIYQVMARVVRGTPGMKKFYLKLTTTEPGQMELTTAYVGAALLLTDRKFFTQFSGSNFDAYTLIVKDTNKKAKDKNIKDIESAEKKGKVKNRKRTPTVVLPPFANWDDAVSMLRDAIGVNLNSPASIYKLSTIGEVRAKLDGKGRSRSRALTEDEIFEIAKGNTSIQDI